MNSERALLIAIAEAMTVLLHHSESSRLARDWQQDSSHSRQLQTLIAQAKRDWSDDAAVTSPSTSAAATRK